MIKQEKKWEGRVVKANEVLIKVKYSALNRADLMQRKGLYPPPNGVSPIIGLEVSRSVENVGSNLQQSDWINKPVCALLAGGGYAEYVTCDVGQVMPIPLDPNNSTPLLTFEQAAAIPETFITAFQALEHIARIQENEYQTVLIHAGASSVGLSAIQLCKLFPSVKHIITTSSTNKVSICINAGATLALDYKDTSKDWSDRIIEENLKVDVILDSIGAPYWEGNIKVANEDASIVYIAMQGGATVSNMNMRPLLTKRTNIHFTTLRARSIPYKTKLIKEFMECTSNLQAFVEKKLDIIIDSTFSMEEIEKAHDRMESMQNAGKILVKMTQ